MRYGRKKNPYSDKSLMAQALVMIISNLKPYPFPYIAGYVSTLGGEERPSILLTVSFQEKTQWVNGILENSQYAKFRIEHNGKIELISGHNVPKFRKRTIKSTHEIIVALHIWAEKLQ